MILNSYLVFAFKDTFKKNAMSNGDLLSRDLWGSLPILPSWTNLFHDHNNVRFLPSSQFQEKTQNTEIRFGDNLSISCIKCTFLM